MTDACRNCSTPLAGRWCHACGQDSLDPFRAPEQLFAEWFDAAWGWDSRLLRTLKLLFGAPGALAEAYVAGRRASFIGPVRLYLIASLLFFATYSLVVDPVIVAIAGLGDLDRGLVGIRAIDRWLPSMMIVLLPSLGVALHAFFRSAGRPLLASQVWMLHFGTISFLTVPVGQVLAYSLQLGTGIDGNLGATPIYAAHAVNVVYMYQMARRFYGTDPATTLVRLAGFSAAMCLVLGLAGTFVLALLVRVQG